MAIIFDGRAYAAEKEANLAIRVLGLKTREVYPKLASILVGNDPASELYVNLKKKAAERIGVEVDIYLIKENSKPEDLMLLIKTLNEDDSVHGIMIQMPLPSGVQNSKSKILNTIAPQKDVDGLRPDSEFLHPTSKAVIDILNLAEVGLSVKPKLVAVVGATGMVGTPLVKELKIEGYEVIEASGKTDDLSHNLKNAEVVISATGIPGLIKANMIKPGAIVIDVGSPNGDVELSATSHASFITPVPGGVGPVTITALLENLILAV